MTAKTTKNEFTIDSNMGDVLRKDPALATVLMRFHVGGCSHCGFEPTDTIGKVAAENGIPADRLLAALNREEAV